MLYNTELNNGTYKELIFKLNWKSQNNENNQPSFYNSIKLKQNVTSLKTLNLKSKNKFKNNGSISNNC